MKNNLRPVQASPEFIRDNQYKDEYEIITRDDDYELFNKMLEYHGYCRVMHFPSGRECFFCRIVGHTLYVHSNLKS